MDEQRNLERRTNRWAWGLLAGLLLLSLLAAASIAWVTLQPRPAIGPFRPGPAYHAPWYRDRGPLPPGPREPGRGQPGFHWPPYPVFTRISPLWAAGRVLATSIFYFLVGVILFALIPERMLRIVRAFQPGGRWSPWTALGVGTLTLLLALLLAALAAFSATGLLFLPGLALLFLLLGSAGFFVAAMWLGQSLRRLMRVGETPWAMDLALGVAALVLLGLIPVAGWLLTALAVVWGSGAILLTRLGAENMEAEEGSGTMQ